MRKLNLHRKSILGMGNTMSRSSVGALVPAFTLAYAVGRHAKSSMPILIRVKWFPVTVMDILRLRKQLWSEALIFVILP